MRTPGWNRGRTRRGAWPSDRRPRGTAPPPRRTAGPRQGYPVRGTRGGTRPPRPPPERPPPRRPPGGPGAVASGASDPGPRLMSFSHRGAAETTDGSVPRSLPMTSGPSGPTSMLPPVVPEPSYPRGLGPGRRAGGIPPPAPVPAPGTQETPDFSRIDFDRLWAGRGKVTEVEGAILARAVAEAPPGRVVEVGAGGGRLTPYLARLGREVVSSDATLALLRSSPWGGDAPPHGSERTSTGCRSGTASSRRRPWYGCSGSSRILRRPSERSAGCCGPTGFSSFRSSPTQASEASSMT